MGLNIKNSAAEEAIRELAALTGDGLTEAITKAAREKIDRIKAEKKTQTVEEFLAAIRHLQDAPKAAGYDPNDKRGARELVNDLYDEHGLPK